MKDSVELVLDALRTRMDQTFKAYYDGDPDLIPDFNLPACVVTKTSDTQETATARQDEVTETIVIKAILNKKDDWTGAKELTNSTEKRLRQIMEERDETGRYRDTSVRGGLRYGLDGSRRMTGSISMEIGVQLRPTTTGADLLTAEAHLTIQLKHSVYVD